MYEYIIAIELIDGRKIETFYKLNSEIGGDALMLYMAERIAHEKKIHNFEYSQVKSFDFYVY